MKKKWLLLGLILILSLALAACTSNDADGEGEDAVDSAPEAVAGELPTEIAQADWVDSKQYVELSTGIKMAYVEMGQDDGEPVILLHGHTDSSRTWAITAQELAKKYHVYCLDQRGSGDSDAPDDRMYTSNMFANDVAAFMDSIECESAYIVGHSMGSAVAQCFGFMYPEKTTKLVLVGSMVVTADESYKESYENYSQPDFEETRTTPEWLDNWDYVTPGILDGKEYQGAVEEMMTYIKEETAKISIYAYTNPPFGSTMCDFSGLMEYLAAETLCIWGVDDFATQDLLAALPNSAGVILYDGCGHSVQWETPIELAQDLDAFFSGTDNEKIYPSVDAAMAALEQ